MRCAAFVFLLTAGVFLDGSRLLATAAAPPSLVPGEKFPDLAAMGLEGTLPDLGTARVVIVDFWASWCAPCKQSFPVYDALQREYGPQGLVIIAVNVERTADNMQKFTHRLQPGFSIVRDGGQKLVAQVAVATMPTAFVLDRHGVVRFVHAGFHGERSRREYVTQIRALLSESP